MTHVGDKILAFRTLKKWTKSRMAKDLGVSSQLLGQYEAGRQSPKYDFYRKWEEVYSFDLGSETNVSSNMAAEEAAPYQKGLMPVQEHVAALNKQIEFLQEHIIRAMNDHGSLLKVIAANWDSAEGGRLGISPGSKAEKGTVKDAGNPVWKKKGSKQAGES